MQDTRGSLPRAPRTDRPSRPTVHRYEALGYVDASGFMETAMFARTNR